MYASVTTKRRRFTAVNTYTSGKNCGHTSWKSFIFTFTAQYYWKRSIY